MLYVVRQYVNQNSYFFATDNIEKTTQEISEGKLVEFTSITPDNPIYRELQTCLGCDIAAVGAITWFDSEPIRELILKTFPFTD